MSLARWTAISCICASFALASPALADDVEQAKTLFNAGAQAYAAGQFPAAIQAFEESYRLAPRPAILFSSAQARRRQYYVDKKPEHLRGAIRDYRRYLELVPQGGRRSDAADALAELEPVAARLGDGGDAAAEPTAAPAVAPTRLMVSSPTKAVEVLLDDKKAGEMPLIEEVTPGKHRVVLRSPGHFDEEREIVAVEGNLVALDVTLRERPAKLDVRADDGAEVAVDGRPMGTVPLSAPLEIAPGNHLVVITKGGHRTYSSELSLNRGESRTLTIDLDVTSQRVASYVLMGVGAVGALGGGALTVLALREQTNAEDILEAQSKGNISRSQLDDYDAARASRDDWRRAAGIAFGGAIAVGGTGILLYAFDAPVVDVVPPKSDQKAPDAPSKPEEPMEVGAVPLLGDGFAGAALLGRF